MGWLIVWFWLLSWAIVKCTMCKNTRDQSYGSPSIIIAKYNEEQAALIETGITKIDAKDKIDVWKIRVNGKIKCKYEIIFRQRDLIN